MILTKEIEIKIHAKNIEHYKNLDYECKLKETIKVNTYDITKGCHRNVTVQCELCKSEKELMISKYWLNHNRQGFYSCKQCSGKKRKITCLETYGLESASQRDEQKERMRTWMSSDEFKDKSKKTMLEIYGFESYSKTEEFKTYMSNLYEDEKFVNLCKENNNKTCLEKYGVENYMLSDEYSEKRSITMNKRYGATYSTQSKIIKEKIRKSFQEKWGVNSPFESKEIQKLAKQSVIEKYGVDNVFKDKDMIENIKQIKIEKGYQVEVKDDYRKYKNKSEYQTRLNKKELFKNWDGYDYYDNEYIKDNFNLNYYDRNYPTIDHMVPILYGYLNNITPEDISDIDNLCITKRSINSKKNSKSIADFNLD